MSVRSAYAFAVSRLRKAQVLRLPVVEWLVSSREEDRRSGRSHLMALAYLRDAIAHPGREVRVQDHMPGVPAPFMNQAIDSIIGSARRSGELTSSNGRFTFFQLEHPPKDSRSRIRASFQAVSQERLEEALMEVRAAAEAALRLGADPEAVVLVAKEAVVRSVMEE